ncbi:MAG TPA: radical SAM protein, partial [Candidatus Eisenbacteria bacterium]|nr:radical SAM protein [Candidatus Eisenbacteria bacterium]
MKAGEKRVIPLDGGTLARCLSSRRLHLILFSTEACNFRCVYCYETFQYKKMEPWVAEGVKRLLERRMPGLDVLELSWFGGEPLLAKDIIEDVLDYAGPLA